MALAFILGGVDTADHAIETQEGVDAGKGRDPCGVSDAAGFDHNIIGPVRMVQNIGKAFAEVIPQRTTDAPIGQFDLPPVLAGDNFGINIEAAKIIDEGGNFAPLRMMQQMVQQGRLAAA